jgi:hypothetical protein
VLDRGSIRAELLRVSGGLDRHVLLPAFQVGLGQRYPYDSAPRIHLRRFFKEFTRMDEVVLVERDKPLPKIVLGWRLRQPGQG